MLVIFSVAGSAARLGAVVRSLVFAGTCNLAGGFAGSSLVYVAPRSIRRFRVCFNLPRQLICVVPAHGSVKATCISCEEAPGGAVLFGPFV